MWKIKIWKHSLTFIKTLILLGLTTQTTQTILKLKKYIVSYFAAVNVNNQKVFLFHVFTKVVFLLGYFNLKLYKTEWKFNFLNELQYRII
jgi:hypothetical protein